MIWLFAELQAATNNKKKEKKEPKNSFIINILKLYTVEI